MDIKEAIQSGYTLCGYADKEYQTLMKIIEVSEQDFEEGKILIADTDVLTPSITSQEIAELLGERVQDNWRKETTDDTDEVYDIVGSIDFSATEKIINDALSSKKYYKLTDIELTQK